MARLKKKLLVLGGSGFIGHHVILEAIKKKWHVVSISFNGKNKQRCVKGAKYIKVNILNFNKLKKINFSFDYIVNCSGYGVHSNYESGGKEIAKTHFFGLVNILKLVDRKKIKKFVHIGSSEEYGNLPSPQNEKNIESPLTPYAKSKTSCTHLLQLMNVLEKFPSIILRIFLAYGPNQDNNRLIPQVINGFLKDKIVKLSSGQQKKDFCYIDDIVHAVFLSIKSKKVVNGQIFNVCSSKPITIKEVVYKIKKEIKKGKPLFDKFKIRNTENLNFYGENKKIRRFLKWKPKINLNDGLEKTIEHYTINAK